MNRISAYTFFTDSHRGLLDYFLATFKYEPEFDLTVRYAKQITIDGTTHDHATKNFITTVRQKLDYINEIIAKTPDGDMFIFLDCDIVFFHPIKDVFINELGDSDIAFQNDAHEFCSGCFICRVSGKTRELFKDSVTARFDGINDQATINDLLKEPKHKVIKTKILSNKICNYDKLTPGIYNPSQSEKLPVAKLKTIDPVLYHTNWTVGVPNKIHMTKLVIQTLTGEVK